MRIGGLMSGVDVDGMVAKMMQSKRIPYDKLLQGKQKLEWQRDKYRDMNSKLLELRNHAFDMKLQSKYMTRLAGSSDPSLKVTASPNAAEGTYQIEVKKLATSAQIFSNASLDTNNKGLEIKLGELAPSITDETTFTIKGKDEVGVTLTLDPDETLGSFIGRINSETAKTGVRVTYDAGLNRLFFDSNTTGAASKIELASSDANFVGGVLKADHKASGQNAEVKYGFENQVDFEFSNNIFSINGMNFTASGVELNKKINVTVTRDNDAIFNNIKGFIDKYNDTIDAVNGALIEKTYRNFAPLTDAQREVMSDKQIEQWEAKATSGLLRNDSILSGAMIAFRDGMYRSVEGMASDDLKALHQIGIKTGEYSERGKLHITESDLRKAIANNPDQVMKLFTANDGDDKSISGDGIAVRLQEHADKVLLQLKEKAGTVISGDKETMIGDKLDDFDKRIDRMKSLLSSWETRYYKQFTALEVAMNQLSSQSSWLSQFGGGQQK